MSILKDTPSGFLTIGDNAFTLSEVVSHLVPDEAHMRAVSEIVHALKMKFAKIVRAEDELVPLLRRLQEIMDAYRNPWVLALNDDTSFDILFDTMLALYLAPGGISPWGFDAYLFALPVECRKTFCHGLDRFIEHNDIESEPGQDRAAFLKMMTEKHLARIQRATHASHEGSQSTDASAT